MPVTEHHEIILELLREQPEVISELLSAHVAVHVPRTATARMLEANANQLRPVEFDADMVLSFEWGDRGEADVQEVLVVVEVQRSKKEEKLRSWPLYHAHLRRKSGGHVLLVVIATTDAVAAWAREHIELGQPASSFVPIVFGPAEAPPMTPEEAWARPALAMLSAFVNLEHPDHLELAKIAMEAWHGCNLGQTHIYWDAMVAELSRSDARRLEAMMDRDPNPARSEWGRRWWQGGHDEGALSTMRDALLEGLDVRGFDIDDDVRERIETCEDLDLLSRWHRRMITAETLEEVFAED